MQPELERQLSQGPVTRIEQRIVKRLAPFVPTSITPNIITIAAAITGILTGVCLVLAAKWRVMLFAASFCMFLHWMGDALDGTVARYFKTSSKTGFYLDHMFDAVVLCAVLIGLYYSNVSDTALPLIFALIYLLMEINIILRAVMFGTFDMSVTIFGPAEANFIFITTNTLAFFFPKISGFALWDVILFVATLFLLSTFFVTFLQTIKKTRILDRKP